MQNNTLIKYNNTNNKFDILVYYKNSKLPILYGLISGSISSYILSYTPIIYTKVVKFLLNDNKNEDNLEKLIYSFILYKFSGTIFAGLRGYIFTKYIHLIATKLKKDIIFELFGKNLNFFYKTDETQTIDILTSDAKKVADLYTIFLNMSVRNTVQLCVVSYILIKKSFTMYIILLMISSIQFIIEECYEIYFYKKSVDNVNNIEIEEKKITADYVNKIITYKSMGLENNFKNIMDNLYNKLIFYKNKEAFYYGISFLVTNTLNNSLQIILIYIGVYFNINYNLIYEFILYINEINSIIREFTIVKRDFVKNKLPLKKIKELFNTKSDNIYWGNYKYNDINECIPSIKIKNLSFSYPNNKRIFQNLNLNINPFTLIGISGCSGIGKSTFFKLLLRLYNKYSGSILIDNIPIETFDRNHYYDNIIAYVGQEPELLKGTINKNILGLNLNNYDIKLYNIILELIPDINNLYETYEKLSGGQKQRIAICRAIMKKPKILLLDEPSSALDIINEKKLLSLLENISYNYNMTIMIISHRNETLKICDKIIDFNNINKNN